MLKLVDEVAEKISGRQKLLSTASDTYPIWERPANFDKQCLIWQTGIEDHPNNAPNKAFQLARSIVSIENAKYKLHANRTVVSLISD